MLPDLENSLGSCPPATLRWGAVPGGEGTEGMGCSLEEARLLVFLLG